MDRAGDKVIPLLEAKGLHVVAVQNPLTSLADDVAATQRAIDAQKGPVILVGHSWGGTCDQRSRSERQGRRAGVRGRVRADVGESSNDLDGGAAATRILQRLPGHVPARRPCRSLLLR